VLWRILLGLNYKEETSGIMHLEHSFVWCRNLDTLANRLEILWTFLHVVLE